MYLCRVSRRKRSRQFYDYDPSLALSLCQCANLQQEEEKTKHDKKSSSSSYCPCESGYSNLTTLSPSLSATPTTTLTYRQHQHLLHPVNESYSVKQLSLLAPARQATSYSLSTQSQYPHQFCESVNANSKELLTSVSTSLQSGQDYPLQHSYSRFTFFSKAATFSHQIRGRAVFLLLPFLTFLWLALADWRTALTSISTLTLPSLCLFSFAPFCLFLLAWCLPCLSLTEERQVNKCSKLPATSTLLNQQLYIQQQQQQQKKQHLSLDQCAHLLTNLSSQSEAEQSEADSTLPLISSARAISHFCTSVARHLLRLSSVREVQGTCHLSASFFDSSSSCSCSTCSPCHSQVRSRRGGCVGEEGVFDGANKQVFTTQLAAMSSPVISSRGKERGSTSERHPHYLWFLCLALLALSEPFLVTCSSSSSYSSSSSIYSNGGSASQLIAPVVYGLTDNSNRRQPKRNLHLGSQRSPVKAPSFTYFEEKDTSVRFSHMCVNVFNGRIYVGGDNGIYQLKMNGSNQLVLEEKAVMGPAEDNPECPANKNCPPNVTKKLSSYYNKALVIDMQHSWLISCGSLYQGACAAHNWNNVSQILHAPMESVVANNATASTVVFIAPGPPPHKYVLYVGATFTIGNYRSDVPAVSSRSLFENRKFTLSLVCIFFLFICLDFLLFYASFLFSFADYVDEEEDGELVML